MKLTLTFCALAICSAFTLRAADEPKKPGAPGDKPKMSAEDAFKKMRADERYRDKMLYAYVGGSGKKLNQELIGTNLIRTIIDCDYRIALERYIFEVSSERASQDALRSSCSVMCKR